MSSSLSEKPSRVTLIAPDGAAKARWRPRFMQSGEPVPNVEVSSSISGEHPDAAWRTLAGVLKLYDAAGPGTKKKLQAMIKTGALRLIGDAVLTNNRTDADGRVEVRYRASHLASSLGSQTPGIEKVTLRAIGGQAITAEIQLGIDGLVPLASTPGLFVISAAATGKHTTQRVADALYTVVEKARANPDWPHPITVTAASLKFGGLYPPHLTHRYGESVDLRPMSTDGNPTWAKGDGSKSENYDSPRTNKLIKWLLGSGASLVLFNGKHSGAVPRPGHDNHIHAVWALRPERFSMISYIRANFSR